MNNIKKTDEAIYNIIKSELNRQRDGLEMIASENFTSLSVMEAMGSVLTNKYAEGYPSKRYYGGCEFVDQVENLARERAKKIFKANYSNVQPHSGSQANMAVYKTFLKAGDTVLGLDLAHGGHLTHGSKVNFSGESYNFYSYGVSKDSGRIDFDQVSDIAKKINPKLIVCGGSAYPRFIEFKNFKEIANRLNCYLMADIAHPSGLIASGLHPSPWPYCDVATTTTHKTLRGPRGGMILMGKDFENRWGAVAPKSGRVKMLSELLDSAVMPGIQGGPLMHVIAAKAVAFNEVCQEDFLKYSIQVIKNAKELAESLMDLGYNIVTNGTDTHIVLVDLSNKGISGKKAERILEECLITANKNMVPFDKKSPLITSGIRLGTPALTSRGMKQEEMKIISRLIDDVLSNIDNESIIHRTKEKVLDLSNLFPLYKEVSYEMS